MHLTPKHATSQNSSCLVPANQHKDSEATSSILRILRQECSNQLSAMSPRLVWQSLRFWPWMLLLLRLFLLITQASVLFLCSQEGHSFPRSTRNPVHRTQYNQAIKSDHWTVFGRGFGTRELVKPGPLRVIRIIKPNKRKPCRSNKSAVASIANC